MKSLTSNFSFLFLSFCLALSLGCTGSQKTSSDRGKSFTFRLASEPLTLDWNRAHTPVETHLLMNLMEGLTTFDDQMNLKPDLADHIDRSKDGKTFTFYLKEGVLWSDGVKMTARDFIYSWKRLLTKKTAASYAYLLFDIVGAKNFYDGKMTDFSKVGVKALNDLTLEVKLSEPIAHWLQMTAFWVTFPLREDLVEKYGNDWVKPGKMQTLGPFVLSEYELDSKIILKKNPKYTRARGEIDEAVGLIVRDDSTAITLFETGRLDFMADLPTLDLKRFRGRPEFKVFPYLKIVFVGFNQKHSEVSSAALRRAFAMSIDKSKIPELLFGSQEPATTFVPPKVLGHVDSAGLPFDPKRAREELSASHWKKPIKTLEIMIINRERNQLLAQFLQQEVRKNLGVDIDIIGFDNKTYRAQLAQSASPIYILSWSADFPDPDNFLSVHLSTSGNNWAFWKNAEYDRLIEKARRVLDPGSRLGLYTQAQKILSEKDAVILPLFYEPNIALVREGVEGLNLNPLNYLIFKNVKIH